MRSHAETPIVFADTLPAPWQRVGWQPEAFVLLTLPDGKGQYTAFESWICPARRLRAWNLAAYQVREEET